MFAVVKISGHQYRVSQGETVVVQHVDGNVGDAVPLATLLVADGEEVKLGKEALNVPVVARIVDHGKGEKIHIRRYRSKSRHRRHIGFRASLTTLAIESIGTVKAAAPVEKSASSPAASKPKRATKKAA